MGERKDRVDVEPVEQVSARVERSRARLDNLVAALDRRRHVVTKARRALHDNPQWTGIGAVALAGAVGGVAMMLVQRQRRRALLTSRVARLRSALSRMIDNPQRVAPRGATIPGKLLTAAGSAAITLLVKRTLGQALPSQGRDQG